ncbi:MAG: hypothetical protein ACE1ZS_09155, partial [Candidatus Poribacteria bacterium]
GQNLSDAVDSPIVHIGTQHLKFFRDDFGLHDVIAQTHGAYEVPMTVCVKVAVGVVFVTANLPKRIRKLNKIVGFFLNLYDER